MTATKCEPPEELRGVDGWHWLEFPGWPPAPYRWSAEMGRWADVCMGYESALAYAEGYRYLAPAPTPDTVRALVEALELYAEPAHWSVDGTFAPNSPTSAYRPDCGDTARAALARAKAEGV